MPPKKKPVVKRRKPLPQKKNSKSFKKGNKAAAGNSNNRHVPSYDAEELATRTIDKRMITRYLTLNSHLTEDQLYKKLEKDHVSILEGMIIRSMIVAFHTGDVNRMDFLFDRLIGKVPNKVEHIKSDPYEGKTIEELMALKKELAIANQKTLEFIERTEHVKQQERNVIEIVARNTPQTPPTESGLDTGDSARDGVEETPMHEIP